MPTATAFIFISMNEQSKKKKNAKYRERKIKKLKKNYFHSLMYSYKKLLSKGFYLGFLFIKVIVFFLIICFPCYLQNFGNTNGS